MSRPLTGTKKQTANAGWRASLPVSRGARTRRSYTFRTEFAADRWLAAGRRAIAAGDPLPEPAAADVVPGPRTRQAEGTPFEGMAMRWAEEYYGELHRGQVDRETTSRGHVTRIARFMADRDLVLETMVREQVKALQASMTRTVAPGRTVEVPEGLDPDGLVTLSQAVKLPGMASRATLKRRIKDDKLVAAERAATGHRYRIRDLYSEEVLGAEGRLRRGPRAKGSLSQGVANDVMWVFEQVCLYARDHGVAVPQDRESLQMHRTDRPVRPDRRPVALSRCVEIAGQLHVVHQLALWLMRVLGLRIGEAYGLRVRDILDHGPELPGAITVRSQGGRTYRNRAADGTTVTSDHVEGLKNENSRRVLVVPPTLMKLVRVVIAVFHTDAGGNVRTDARLIPGLRKRDAGGQAALRTALAAAAARARVDCGADEDALDEVFSCTPHDMRRTVLSDLDRLGAKDSHIQRLAGHVPGTAVLHRHYLLDDPKLRPAREIADLVERELCADLPAGLMVPTLVRCTTGWQRELAVDATRIDVELVERGWLVVPGEEDGDPWLGAVEVASELGVTPQTARRWMAEGLVPSIAWADRPRGTERRSRLSDVVNVCEHLRSQVTVRSIAGEVDQPYHSVYQFIRAQGLALEPWGERDYVLPLATADQVRGHYARQADLHRRAVPVSVAASTLGVTVTRVRRLVEDGVLVADARTHDGRRMVTRSSLASAQAEYGTRIKGPQRPREELVRWSDARDLTGLADAELEALVADGTLVREQYQRRRHLTRSSILGYLVVHAPARLQIATPRDPGQATSTSV